MIEMKMRKLLYLVLGASCLLTACTEAEKPKSDLRAPAYPLVTIDPYTSAWSTTDNLYDSPVKHWTGKNHPLIGVVRVDGKSYRFMGKENLPLYPIVDMASVEAWEGNYTLKEPKKGWEKVDFNPKGWTKGKAAFGTPEMLFLGTEWTTKDIWVRREFDLNRDLSDADVFLKYSHDDTFELYINGKQVVKTGYEWHNNVVAELKDEVKKTLKPGKNVIAAYCKNKTGGGYVDFGLYVKEPDKTFFDQEAEQVSAMVLPTQTLYAFEAGPVQLDVTFTAPLLCDDLYLMARPVNYISYEVVSKDGQQHDVQVYIEATPQWAVNETGQPVVCERLEKNGQTFLKAGTKEQPVLAKRGDDLRIDWGYFYLVGNTSDRSAMMIADYYTPKKAFAANGKVENTADRNLSGNMNKEMIALAYSEDLGKVGTDKVAGHVLIGYDDLYSIQYFGKNLMPYWKKNGQVTIEQEFAAAEKDYRTILSRCDRFDRELMDEAAACGGKEYAELCALVYRQAIAAHKLVANGNGELMFFSKENFSNGSIGTVDITYPSSPLFLKYNVELAKGLMNFIFEYSESGKWSKPFAAHDVGTYPLANGQTYGGDMPVEETGNMLILTTAIAHKEGNADYAAKHWDMLTTWADFLLEKGLDPENQLCTDDFAGHFAHNANLSIKAIMGIAGYGKMAGMLGKKDIVEKYTQAAKEMAGKWVEMAADGDHYKLTFDKAGTWSQKYNLVWDELLGLNIFPKEVAQKEIAYYLTKQNLYGLPLDSRRTYTKSDWIMWTATMAPDVVTMQKFIAPVYKYANETGSRVPISDWHETPDAKQVGFQARSVVGGYFMPMLKKELMK